MKLLKLFLLIALLSLPSWAQRKYYYQETFSLSGEVFSVTVQQPSTSPRPIQFTGAQVRCTAEVTVTLEKNGTAASNTATTSQVLDGRARSSTSVVYTDSDVGDGTDIVVDKAVANELLVFTGSGLYIPASVGTQGNFTLKSNSITASCYVYIQWEE